MSQHNHAGSCAFNRARPSSVGARTTRSRRCLHSLLCDVVPRYEMKRIVAILSARTEEIVHAYRIGHRRCALSGRSGVANTQGWNSLSGFGAADVEGHLLRHCHNRGRSWSGSARIALGSKMQAVVDEFALKWRGKAREFSARNGENRSLDLNLGLRNSWKRPEENS